MFPLFGLVERPRELVAASKLSALRLGPPEVAPVHPVFVGEFDTAKLTGSTAFGGSTKPLLITLQRTLIELNVIRRGVWRSIGVHVWRQSTRSNALYRRI